MLAGGLVAYVCVLVPPTAATSAALAAPPVAEPAARRQWLAAASLRYLAQHREELEARLETVRAQITTLQATLEGLQERRSSMADQFERVDVQLALSRRELELHRLRREVLLDELAEERAEVTRSDAALRQGKKDLAARIRALYRMGPLSYTRFLLAATTAQEVMTNYQFITRLAASDRSLIASMRIHLEERRLAVAAMEETEERLAALEEEEARTVAGLEAQQTERREIIRRLDMEADSGRQALARQEVNAAQLEGMMSLLVQQQAPAEGDGDTATATEVDTDTGGPAPAPAAAPESAPPATFEAARGELPWPGDGSITLSFGRQRHPVYDTYTLSKGIEIAAEADSPVRAVFGGRVAFADWFRGYGQVVIINHGDDYFTLYGHLAVIDVRAGEWVEAGSQVGTVGETGSLSGPSLYFEVREGTDALNPSRWLRRR
jgi:septal ring factor EnvC (AmiA/AmiB activator)